MKKTWSFLVLFVLFPQLVWADGPVEVTDALLKAGDKSIPGGELALAAYVVLWFLLLGYFVVMTMRIRGLKQSVRELDKRIDELAG